MSMQVSQENFLSTATLSQYFRSCFHVMYYVTFIFLEIIYVIITVAQCMTTFCSFAAAVLTTGCACFLTPFLERLLHVSSGVGMQIVNS